MKRARVASEAIFNIGSTIVLMERGVVVDKHTGCLEKNIGPKHRRNPRKKSVVWQSSQ